MGSTSGVESTEIDNDESWLATCSKDVAIDMENGHLSGYQSGYGSFSVT
jgi:hypothetical protein